MENGFPVWLLIIGCVLILLGVIRNKIKIKDIIEISPIPAKTRKYLIWVGIFLWAIAFFWFFPYIKQGYDKNNDSDVAKAPDNSKISNDTETGLSEHSITITPTQTETQEVTMTPTKTTSQEIIDFINEEVNIEFKKALGDIDSRWKQMEKYFCSDEAIDNLEAFRKWISRDFGNSIEVEIETELIKEPIILENGVWEFIQIEIWKFQEDGVINPKKWEIIYEITKNVDGNYCIYKYDRKVIE